MRIGSLRFSPRHMWAGPLAPKPARADSHRLSFYPPALVHSTGTPAGMRLAQAFVCRGFGGLSENPSPSANSSRFCERRNCQSDTPQVGGEAGQGWPQCPSHSMAGLKACGAGFWGRGALVGSPFQPRSPQVAFPTELQALSRVTFPLDAQGEPATQSHPQRAGIQATAGAVEVSPIGLHVPPVESRMAILRISNGTQRCLILPLETEETSRKAASKRPDIIKQRLV
jgi:hypothetical protein